MNNFTQQNIIVPEASPAMALMQNAAYSLQLEQMIRDLREQLASLENPPDRLQKKVVIAAMMMLLAQLGVTLANTDRSKIARLLEALTGFSQKSILKMLEEDKDFAECHYKDVQQLNHLLSDVGLQRIAI